MEYKPGCCHRACVGILSALAIFYASALLVVVGSGYEHNKHHHHPQHKPAPDGQQDEEHHQPCTKLWADVRDAIDAYPLDNVTVFIGDMLSNATVLVHAKGGSAVAMNQSIPVASASKWVSTAVIMRLVSLGTLSLDDHPQDYLPFW
jgi:CubicO group peptidase (beta-lactamase class C family)